MNRIAVISDVHSNLQALTAVLARIDTLAVDGIYCLGDIVGYGARPSQCLDLVRERATASVQGNHDALIADPTLRLDFNIYSLAAVAHNRGLLSTEQLDWLRALPTRLRVDDRTQFVHGAPGDRDRYLVFLDDLQEAATALLEDDGPGVCFFGHTHHQVLFDGQNLLRPQPGDVHVDPSRRVLINPGSVGQPRDGDPRAAFAVYEPAAERVVFHRVEYDIEGARQDILAAGLPRLLADRLLQGR
ncbi:MAG: metallophosphoesterase family protein [bacterium]|nr:metallophosphoesterase family protein [bacterium]